MGTLNEDIRDAIESMDNLSETVLGERHRIIQAAERAINRITEGLRLYIDVNDALGDDSNPGTVDQPLKTVDEALSRVVSGAFNVIRLHANQIYTVTGDKVSQLTAAGGTTLVFESSNGFDRQSNTGRATLIFNKLADNSQAFQMLGVGMVALLFRDVLIQFPNGVLGGNRSLIRTGNYQPGTLITVGMRNCDLNMGDCSLALAAAQFGSTVALSISACNITSSSANGAIVGNVNQGILTAGLLSSSLSSGLYIADAGEVGKNIVTNAAAVAVKP